VLIVIDAAVTVVERRLLVWQPTSMPESYASVQK